MRNALLLMLISSAVSVNAETVHLKNGDILRGNIEAVSGGVVQINTKYGVLNIPKDTMLTIDFRPEGQIQSPLAEPANTEVKAVQTSVTSAGFGPGDGESLSTSKPGAIKVFWDNEGSYDVSASLGPNDVSIGGDVNSGVSVAYEYVSPLSAHSSILGGVGINYQFPRGFTEDDVKFNFISGYFIGKIPIDDLYSSSMKKYVIGEVGVGLGLLHNVDESLDASLNGGLYLGGGLEFKSQTFGFTLLYSMNKGELSILDQDFDVNYQKFSFGVGYYF